MRNAIVSFIFLFLMATSQSVLAESLCDAAGKGDIRLINKLLGEGADVNLRGEGGWSALICAAWDGQAQATQVLLANGADVIIADNNHSFTALHFAAKRNNAEVVKVLLANGVDANIKNSWGVTPLMAASDEGSTEAIKVLLKNRADINAKDSTGKTALMYAAYGGHEEGTEPASGNPEAIQTLLAYDADTSLKNNDGETALDFAKAYNSNKAAVEMLQKATKK